MNKVNILGIDLAKRNYQVFGTNQDNDELISKQFSRGKLIEYVSNLNPCLVAMEACSGAHYMGRKFREMGHEIKLLPPQHVKPFVYTNKDDAADAEAITEAATKKRIHPIPIKEKWHQDIQFIHKIRERYGKTKTSYSNAIRSMLHEYGIIIPRGDKNLKRHINLVLIDNRLSDFARDNVRLLYEEYLTSVNGKINQDKRLAKIARSNSVCKALLKIPGVGIITATALLASVPDVSVFKRGRSFSAWLGVIPKHVGTGGKNKNLGMSKRGNQYLRYLLIHGARAVIRVGKNKEDNLSRWCNRLVEKRGYNKACVAMANKTARIIWAMMSTGEEYQADKASRLKNTS